MRGDRGTQQDLVRIGGEDDAAEATYRDASYLGTDEEDEEEVQDLGFIVDDREDRRMSLLRNWQRTDDPDSDEALEVDPDAPIPHRGELMESGVPPEAFATDFNISHARGERQEEDFAETSMLHSDPDSEAGEDDFTGETLAGDEGEPLSTDLTGRVPGVVGGLGTSVPIDFGSGGLSVRDNPLMQRQGQPISDELLSDEALGPRHDAEMGDGDELDRLADRGAQEIEKSEDTSAPLSEKALRSPKR